MSLADLIVLGGGAAVEQAAKDAGHDIPVPFTPGRSDASQEQTDVESFAAPEPMADGFRNYLGKGHPLPAEYLLLHRTNLLTLSAPEMTILVGRLRVLGANTQQSGTGVPTPRPGTPTNDFLANLLDLDTTWTAKDEGLYEARDAAGQVTWTGSRVDLLFGSNSELRAISEVYASDDAQAKFVGAQLADLDDLGDRCGSHRYTCELLLIRTDRVERRWGEGFRRHRRRSGTRTWRGSKPGSVAPSAPPCRPRGPRRAAHARPARQPRRRRTDVHSSHPPPRDSLTLSSITAAKRRGGR